MKCLLNWYETSGIDNFISKKQHDTQTLRAVTLNKVKYMKVGGSQFLYSVFLRVLSHLTIQKIMQKCFRAK